MVPKFKVSLNSLREDVWDVCSLITQIPLEHCLGQMLVAENRFNIVSEYCTDVSACHPQHREVFFPVETLEHLRPKLRWKLGGG